VSTGLSMKCDAPGCSGIIRYGEQTTKVTCPICQKDIITRDPEVAREVAILADVPITFDSSNVDTSKE